MRKIWIWLSLVEVASGCGHHHSNQAGAPSVGDFSLTGDQNKAFEHWQKTTFKACDANAAFGGQAPADDIGIDTSQFLPRLNHSFAMQDSSSGQFLLLQGGVAPTSTFDSQLDSSVTHDGDQSTFAATAHRDGGHCVVTLNQKVVYDTVIWAQVPTLLYGEGLLAKPFAAPPSAAATSGDQVQQDLLKAVLAAGGRDTERLAFLQQRFADVDASLLPQLFPKAEPLAGEYGAQVTGEVHVPIFDLNYPQLDASLGPVQKLTAAAGQETVALWLRPARDQNSADANTADTGLWRVDAQLAWTTAANRRQITVQKLQLNTDRANPPKAFNDCFATRQQTFDGDPTYGVGPFAPSYGLLVQPCSVFASNVGTALAADPDFVALVGRLFKGVTGLPNQNLNGWDAGLELMADQALVSKTSLTSTLDPQHQSPLIDALDHLSVTVTNNVAALPPLAADHDLLLHKLAYGWALNGIVVDDATIAKALRAFANIRQALPEASSAWVEDLAAAPTAQAAQTAYALAFTDAMKSQLQADEAAAARVHIDDVFNDVKRSQILKKRTSAAELTAWMLTLNALQEFDSRETGRASAASPPGLEQGAFHDLAAQATEEDWQDSDFKDAEALSSVAVLIMTCEQSVTVSGQLGCANLAAVSKTTGGMLAAAFAGRYGAFAPVLAKDVTALPMDQSFDIQDDLARGFFEPLWKTCDNATFQSNRESLDKLLASLPQAAMEDQMTIKQNIRTLLGQCSN